MPNVGQGDGTSSAELEPPQRRTIVGTVQSKMLSAMDVFPISLERAKSQTTIVTLSLSLAFITLSVLGFLMLYFNQYLPMATAVIYTKKAFEDPNTIKAVLSEDDVHVAFTTYNYDGNVMDKHFIWIAQEATYTFDDSGNLLNIERIPFAMKSCGKDHLCHKPSDGFQIGGIWQSQPFTFLEFSLFACKDGNELLGTSTAHCATTAESSAVFYDPQVEKNMNLYTAETYLSDDGVSLTTHIRDFHKVIFSPDPTKPFRWRMNCFWGRDEFVVRRRWFFGTDETFKTINVRGKVEFESAASIAAGRYVSLYMRTDTEDRQTTLSRMSFPRLVGVACGLVESFSMLFGGIAVLYAKYLFGDQSKRVAVKAREDKSQ